MKKLILSILLLFSVSFINAQTYAYTVGTNCIEFKTGLIVTNVPTPLLYVKLDTNKLVNKIYIYSASGDIIFPAKGLPINGFTTLLDLYNDLKVYSCSALLVLDSNSWKLGGNNISSANYIGTNNAQPFVIKTNGSEKARITTTGKVGINTNAPTSTLDVAGDMRIRGLVASTTDSVIGIDDSGYLYKTFVSGGGSSYYLYSENYDAGSFYPSTVTGLNAVSIGVGNNVSGDGSTAIGAGNTASGNTSIAFGKANIASSGSSTAIGNGTTASGELSISIGSGNIASGELSMATGYETTAKSYVETSLGFQNTDYTPISDIAFEPTDRLIVVGNGNGATSDAFTILKNGKTAIGIDNFETTTNEAKLQVNGFYATSIEVINSNTTLDASTCASIIIVDNSASSKTIILPIASEMFFNGMTARIIIKRKSTNHNITINPQSGSNIDGATHYDYTGNDKAFEFVTDGAKWYKL
jgi:hypothetical protein